MIKTAFSHSIYELIQRLIKMLEVGLNDGSEELELNIEFKGAIYQMRPLVLYGGGGHDGVEERDILGDMEAIDFFEVVTDSESCENEDLIRLSYNEVEILHKLLSLYKKKVHKDDHMNVSI